ncbi:MAG: phosphate ABC transporter permease subunit PstC [Pseudomonadota bacterium]
MTLFFLLALVVIAAVGFFIGNSRALQVTNGRFSDLHSRPAYHGGYVAILAAGPAFIVLMLWSALAPGFIDGQIGSRISHLTAGLSDIEQNALIRDAKTLAGGGAVAFVNEAKREAAEIYRSVNAQSNIGLGVVFTLLAGVGLYLGRASIAPERRNRQFVERVVMGVLIACSAVAILTTVGIVLSLIFESYRFFLKVPFLDFLFGIQWSPQTALRADQVGSTGAFGAIPLFVGTLLITAIAIAVAAPIGLLSAIYLSDYASSRFRAVAKPILEILAGIPTVVYGFFAALTVAPFFREAGTSVGLTVSSESALAAGVVMGIMIIPFVSSLSDDVINAVPQSLRDGSAGLGATKSETIRKVVLPAALPGIISALLLAVSRAIGENMIVVMAAGLAANLTINPLEAVTTVTVQIVTLLVGDQEFDSAKTLAAFALGLVLFCITLALNVVALRVVQKYREAYD